jgi:hypothetical protein
MAPRRKKKGKLLKMSLGMSGHWQFPCFLASHDSPKEFNMEDIKIILQFRQTSDW